jgi:flagellar hook assembly protein FlgD
VKGQELIFQTLPFEVYMTFEDGPGRYQLEVVDESGRPLRMVFDGKIVGEKDTWVNWDGKDSRGQAVQPGHYYLVFYKDGKAIKSISVYLTGQGGH